MSNVNQRLSEWPELMTVKQGAVRLQSGVTTIYRAIGDGSLPAIKVRGSYRIPREAIERLIADAMEGTGE